MGLNEEERRRLDELAHELEAELASSDPDLAAELGSAFPRRRHRMRIVAYVLTVSSIPLAVLGISTTEPILFALAAIIVTAAALGAVLDHRRPRDDHRLDEH